MESSKQPAEGQESNPISKGLDVEVPSRRFSNKTLTELQERKSLQGTFTMPQGTNTLSSFSLQVSLFLHPLLLSPCQKLMNGVGDGVRSTEKLNCKKYREIEL